MDTALPALRDDLSLLAGPCDHDGAPTWTLHDPLSNRFFRLPWAAFEILNRWHLGEAGAVAESVCAETPLDIEAEDVAGMVEFLGRGQLLKVETRRDVARLLAAHDATKTSWLTWLLHHYLFFRIPLVRPNQFLDALLPYVDWLGRRAFRLTTVVALVTGLFLVARQWDVFKATLVDHFSLSGLAAFGIALGLAKVVHELGHALTAKSYGLRVPTMGAAFLVLMPVLYTDVNEAWTLTSRRQRLMVGAAGILAELTLAVWATLAWGLLPDGTARTMAFTLAATTWISSLAINLSPFMRFDGYFLAMDALDQPNLHPRSFALARWHLRETLFALGEPAPEALPPATRAWMIAFAWCVWIYRLTLFLGIAVLVYHFFIKVVGVLLFVVEIGWFVVKPFWGEFAQWGKRLPAIRASGRTRWPLGFLLAILVLLVVPWSGRVSAPAMLKAERHLTLYAPSPARLEEVVVRAGERVAAGTVLVRLDSPDARARLEQVARRVAVLRYELSAIGFDDTFRARAQSIAEELGAAMAEQTAMTAELQRLTLVAPVAGTAIDLSPELQPGQWISPRDPVLGLADGGQIEAYVAEADLPRITVGARANFIPDGGHASIPATLAAIDRVAAKSLSEPALAVPFGGTIPARFDSKALVPDTALYRVRLKPDGPDPVMVPLRGQVHMDGERRSLLGHALRTMAATLIREWGM